MVRQVINVGTSANDGTGDPLRTAFTKINSNFAEIYAVDAVGSNLDISDNQITATNTNGNVEFFPNQNGYIVVKDNSLVITTSNTPASSVGAAGDVTGMLAWDSNYLYVATGNYDGSTQIWKKTAINTGGSAGQAVNLVNGNSNVIVDANANVRVSVKGTSNVVIITNNAANIAGNINVTGTATVANLVTVGLSVNPGRNANLGLIANVKILGGTNGQIITTDGTGNLSFISPGATQYSIVKSTSNVTVNNDGNVTISVSGIPNVASFSSTGMDLSGISNFYNDVTIAGSLQVNGALKRFYADFSNAGPRNRFAFQSSTLNGNTSVGAIPNGTATRARFTAHNNYDSGNASTMILMADASFSAIASDYTGSGSLLPLAIRMSGSNVMVFDTSGNANITGNLNISGTANVVGNANVGNLGTGGLIVATGNVTAGNLVTGGNLSVTGNANVGNLGTSGTITSGYFVGDGSLLTNLLSSIGEIRRMDHGISNITIPLSGGDVNVSVNGVDGVLNINPGGINVVGQANVNSLRTLGDVTSLGNMSATGNLAISGNIDIAGNVIVASNISTANLSITGNLDVPGEGHFSGLVRSTSNIYAANLVTTGNVLMTSASMSGALTLTGVSGRINGDFSNATVTSRTMFQTTATSDVTNLGALPTGTAFGSRFSFYSKSDIGNTSVLLVGHQRAQAYFAAEKNGSGDYKPLNFFVNGSYYGSGNPDLSIGTDGNITANANLRVNGNITANYLLGDGGYLSNVTAIGLSVVANGASNINIPVTNGNITFNVTNTPNVIVVSNTETTMTGNIKVAAIKTNTYLYANGQPYVGAAPNTMVNGTSNITVDSSGPVRFSPGGASNVVVVTNTALNAANISVTGNISAQYNITSAQGNLVMAAGNIQVTTGNITVHGDVTAADFIATGNINAHNTVTSANIAADIIKVNLTLVPPDPSTAGAGAITYTKPNPTANKRLAVSDGSRWLSISSENFVVNVKDFGATGDGSADDRAAIQAAIDSLFDGTYLLPGVILFPPGNYLIRETYVGSGVGVKMHEGIELRGMSSDSCTLTAGANNMNLILYNNTSGVTKNFFTVRNLILQTNASGCTAIRITGDPTHGSVTSIVKVDNVYMGTFATGLSLEGVSNVFITNSFANVCSVGFQFVNSANVNIVDCMAQNGGGAGFSITGTGSLNTQISQGFRMTGCSTTGQSIGLEVILQYWGQASNCSFTTGTDTRGMISLQNAHNWKFTGCEFGSSRGVQGASVNSACSNIIFSGCQFMTNNIGLNIYGKSVNVTGCQFFGNSDTDLYIGSTALRTAITGCIMESAISCVEQSGADYTMVTGCITKGPISLSGAHSSSGSQNIRF